MRLIPSQTLQEIILTYLCLTGLLLSLIPASPAELSREKERLVKDKEAAERETTHAISAISQVAQPCQPRPVSECMIRWQKDLRKFDTLFMCCLKLWFCRGDGHAA